MLTVWSCSSAHSAPELRRACGAPSRKRRVRTSRAAASTAFDAAEDYFPDKVDASRTPSTSASPTTARTRSWGFADRRPAIGPSGTCWCSAARPTAERLKAIWPVRRSPRVPIASLYSASTTHLPLLVDLRRLDVLTGVSR